MASAVERLLAVAQGEVGYYEKASNAQLDSKTANKGTNNWTKYARDLDTLKTYNGAKNGYYWCDVFVDWLFVQTFGWATGLAMIGQRQGDCGAGCTFSAQYYDNMGRLFYSNPQPGDQIFFGDRWSGDYYHTGVVYKVDDNYVYTIEGNTTANDGVNGNGDGVARKQYRRTYGEIGAYGRPRWELAPADKEEIEVTMTKDELKKLIKDTVKEVYNELNPMYKEITDVPKWWVPVAQALLDTGAVNGGTPREVNDHDLNLREETLKAAVIAVAFHRNSDEAE